MVVSICPLVGCHAVLRRRLVGYPPDYFDFDSGDSEEEVEAPEAEAMSSSHLLARAALESPLLDWA